MKVFSIEKYCEDRGCAPSDFEQYDWMVKSNGKTEEEMYRMGYVTSESWMVEEPSALVFSEELYKKCVGKDRPLTSDDWAYGLDGRSKEDIESNTHYEIDEEWCYKKTPVERFEVGKWYRFNGSKAGRSWNSRTMSVVLDNKPRLCTGGFGADGANFEGVEPHPCEDCGWYWGDLSLWEEVQAPKSKMTERETCERIVMEGHCAGVECGDCPLSLCGEWNCDDMDEVTLAKMWLRLHPCEKKLVFSKEKFCADEGIPLDRRDRALLCGWPEDCDGKTEEECEELGFAVHPDWMEER